MGVSARTYLFNCTVTDTFAAFATLVVVVVSSTILPTVALILPIYEDNSWVQGNVITHLCLG